MALVDAELVLSKSLDPLQIMDFSWIFDKRVPENVKTLVSKTDVGLNHICVSLVFLFVNYHFLRSGWLFDVDFFKLLLDGDLFFQATHARKQDVVFPGVELNDLSEDVG